MYARLVRVDLDAVEPEPEPEPEPELMEWWKLPRWQRRGTSARVKTDQMPPQHLSCLPGLTALFALTHATDGHAARFAARKAAAGEAARSGVDASLASPDAQPCVDGGYFKWHGSKIGNWFSILRNGLRPLSSTPLMAHGAAFGKGIYTADKLHVSLAYSCPLEWSQVMKALFQQSIGSHTQMPAGLCVVALTEVVSSAQLASPSGLAASLGRLCYVIQEADDLTVRYLALMDFNDFKHRDPAKGCHASTLRWSPEQTMHQHVASLHEFPSELVSARARAEELLTEALGAPPLG